MSEDRDKLLPTGPPPSYNYSQPSGQPTAPPPPYYQPVPGQIPPQAPPQVHQQGPILVEQGRPIIYQRPIYAPPDYTYLAVLATICFFPLGLVALFMANKVKQDIATGNTANAYTEAITVRLLSRLSISIGTFILVIIILSIVLPMTLSD